MKNRIMKSALSLCLCTLAGFASSAHADFIEITFDETSEVDGTYIWEGFVFTGVQLSNGQCDEAPCINLVAGRNVTLTYMPEEENLPFTLSQFYYSFQGRTELTVTCVDDPTDENCVELGSAVFSNSTGTVSGILVNNSGAPFFNALTDVLSVNFHKTGTGNIRLDTFCLTPEGCDNGGGTPVPEPGTLGLLGLGLLGLAMNRRRKI